MAEAAAGEVGGACGVFGEMPTRRERAQGGDKFGSAAKGTGSDQIAQSALHYVTRPVRVHMIGPFSRFITSILFHGIC
jgi:hypothetical protein